MFASVKSRSDSKLDHLGLKTRSPGQISKKNLGNTLAVTFFEAVIMNLAQYVCLDDF